jgi:hypothetical protein
LRRPAAGPILPPSTSSPAPGDVIALQADTSPARDLLGFVATVDLVSGVRRYIDWFRSAHPDPTVLLDREIRNWEMPGE